MPSRVHRRIPAYPAINQKIPVASQTLPSIFPPWHPYLICRTQTLDSLAFFLSLLHPFFSQRSEIVQPFHRFFLSTSTRCLSNQPTTLVKRHTHTNVSKMYSSSVALLFALVLAISTAASPVMIRANNGDVNVLRSTPEARTEALVQRQGGKKGKGGNKKGGKKGGKGKAVAGGAAVAGAGAAAAGAAKAGTNPTATPPAPNDAAAAGSDLQKSLTLDPSVICTNFTDDGQNPPVAGQSASSTSTNNYINFCALTLPGTPLTNGGQITGGSCNPTPIGLIPSSDKMPSAKFNFPRNGDTINANIPFNATLNVANFHTGVFTNAQKTYFAAPQTLDPEGLIIGHSHMVIETLTSLDQITPTDPKKFFFFKGVDGAAVNGELSVFIANGLPAGAYRICSINSSSNHQPVIVSIAQHGSLDDCAYFTSK